MLCLLPTETGTAASQVANSQPDLLHIACKLHCNPSTAGSSARKREKGFRQGCAGTWCTTALPNTGPYSSSAAPDLEASLCRHFELPGGGLQAPAGLELVVPGWNPSDLEGLNGGRFNINVPVLHADRRLDERGQKSWSRR
ncbi:hypothetical protein GN244_ATG06438 [Phytophthora infestans]|uniref:Uncharacterized protein n=1 Tax=Phytophthora infestans TaxID=4787 RepID=A0A833SXJ3_PHYIN|nr:hypothetical protein GN244_ATG06438 [Phytophthora infestans]KAF4149667.1 hypothetical protein GN958_ATG01063 [Phytophthora infestans]